MSKSTKCIHEQNKNSPTEPCADRHLLCYHHFLIIIIIIFINCNWDVTRWQWLFYMYTKYEIGY